MNIRTEIARVSAGLLTELLEMTEKEFEQLDNCVDEREIPIGAACILDPDDSEIITDISAEWGNYSYSGWSTIPLSFDMVHETPKDDLLAMIVHAVTYLVDDDRSTQIWNMDP